MPPLGFGSPVRAFLLLLLLLPATGHLPLVLQLSDLHVSSLSPAADVTRSPDLHLLAALLPQWQLDAIVITGDLTDAKTQGGGSQQQEQEWKEYQGIWQGLVEHSGLPASLILDLRGNHDALDIVRGGRSDFFTRYSARAAAAADSCHKGLQAASSAAEKGASAARDNASCSLCAGCERMYIDQLPPQPPSAPGSSSSPQQEGDVSCPQVVLLGLDATPDPGLRSPTNFLGVVEPALLHEAEARLQQLHSSLSSRSCRPQILAYGHYPLSTIATIGYPAVGSRGSYRPQACSCTGPEAPCSPSGPASSACPGACIPSLGPDVALRPAVSWTSSIKQLLARYNVSTYLCGHLHDAFGLRLHKMHGQQAASQGSFLAELELPDWKYSRYLRLLTFDQQAGTSFTDLTFRRNVTADSQPQLGSLDQSRKLNGFIVLIASPPDARYFPLHSLASHQPPAEGPSLRALLLPVPCPTCPLSSAPRPLVTGLLSCGPSGTRAQGQGQQTVQRFPLLPVPSDPGMFEALLPLQAACTGPAWVQVEVQQRPGPEGPAGEARLSTSELRAVPGSWLPGHEGGPAKPAALGSTCLAWLVLTASWPGCGTWAFRIQWLLLFGLMLVQLLPHSYKAVSEDPAAGRHHSRVRVTRAVKQAGQPGASAGAVGTGPSPSLLLLPLVSTLKLIQGIFEDSALQPLFWWFRGWLLYLLLGPWLLACVGSAGGERGEGECPWPPAVLTAHGIYLTNSSGNWQLSTTQDMAIVTSIHLATCVCPGTLWMLWLVRGWHAAGHSLLRQPGASITWQQALTLVILLCLHGVILSKLFVGFGILSVLVSPGIGWVVPLGAAWLISAHRRLHQQRAGPVEQEKS